jgi:hypothetical protein
MKSKRKKPYSERHDIDKIKSNWKKIRGMYNRKEWSGLIVRAATAVEITANLVVREELIDERKLDPEFVDSLLLWANGLQGKFTKLILPVTKKAEYHQKLKKLNTRVTKINKERNSVAHSGQFKKKTTAERIIREAREVILAMVDIYYEDFELDEIVDNENKRKR